MRRTIIHITESLARGGTETLIVGVINALTEYEHVIISMKHHNHFEKELENVKIIYLNLKGYQSIPRLAHKIKKVVFPYRDKCIVHSHMFWANVVSRLAITRSIPLVSSYHSVSYGRVGANYPLHAVLLDRFTYTNRVKTICVSSAVQDNVERFIGIKSNVRVLYNYVNDIFFQGTITSYQPQNPLKLVSVGNLKQQKNYQTTLEAMAELKRRGYDSICSLDIYGSGPLLHKLQAKATELGVTNVTFKGLVNDVFNRLKNYDAYLLSSSFEGFGIAVAEAMAAGLPVIVSNLPVLQEVTGGNALFFNPGKPTELADHIESVYNGRVDLLSLAISGKAYAEKYRKQRYIEKLTEIYEEVSKNGK